MSRSVFHKRVLVAVTLLLISAAFFASYSSVPPAVPPTVTTDCEIDPAKVSRRGPPPDRKPLDHLHTCGNKIFNAEGKEVRITGINWFGMETGTFAPHGLWSRSWQSLLDQVATLGYNTIRLPYSNEMLEPGRMPLGIDYDLNPDLDGLTSLEVLDKVVEGASERGIKIILDRHRPDSNGQSDLWYTPDVSEERWIADWQMLALRYVENDAVIAVDLHNEPKQAATWGSGDPKTDWRLAAERAGNAILETNPYLLIFVQGIEKHRDDWYWWGGNLTGVAQNPVRLKVPNRVVYSPHDYGPEVYMQGWFFDATFPQNLPDVWDRHWGYIHKQNLAPVVLGEFGGRSVGEDAAGQWQHSLLEYLANNAISYINWSLNPNSADTGGLLGEDWETVVKEKQSLYSENLAPPIAEGILGPPPAKLKLQYRNLTITETTDTIAFAIRLQNDGAWPLDLARVQVRYWFSAGDLKGQAQLVDVDFAAIGKDHVKPRVVKATQGDQDSYVLLAFDNVLIKPYASSGDILVRIHKPDWSTYVQSNDYSFSSLEEFTDGERVTGYVDGQLARGVEP